MITRNVSGILAVVIAVALLGGCDIFVSTEGRIARAEQRLAEGDYERALAEAKKALEKDPDSAQARLLLAEASLKLGDVVTADKELDRAAAGGADKAAAAPLRVETRLAQGRADEAAEALAAATTMSGPEHDVLEGRVLLAQRQPQAAEAMFGRALAGKGESTEARVGRAEALIAQAKFDEARTELAALLAARPDAGAGWLMLATLEVREGHFTDAAAAFGKAVDNGSKLTQPQRAQAAAGQVEALVLAGDLEGAGRAVPTLDRVAGGSLLALLTRSRLALARGDAGVAVESLQRVVQAVPGEMAPRAMLIEALTQQGSLEQALAEAGKLVGDFPDSDPARLALAQVQLRANQPDQAERTLEPLIERSMPSAEALAMAAQIRLREGQAGTGIEFLERGLQADPDNARLRIELAGAYVSTGRGSQAVEMLRAIPDGPMSAQRDRLLVVAVAASANAALAREEIDRALAAHPEDTALLTLAASYYASQDEAVRAREFLDRALAIQPGDAAASLGVARLEIMQGNMEGATARVRDVLKAAPNQLAALGLMAEIAYRKGEPAEVERWLEEARRADAGTVEPRLFLARAALARGDAARADLLIAEVDQVAARRAPVQVAIGDLLAAAGRRDQALQRYRRAIELDGSLPQAHLGLGRTLMQDRGNDAAARTELQRALALRPGWPPATVALAMLEAGSGRGDEALRIVADLKQRTPNDAAPYTLEGDVRWVLRQPAEAARAYEAALAREPNGVVAARAAAARLAAGIGHPEQPLVKWLEGKPGDIRARASLANMYLQTGRQAESIAEYEKVVAAQPKDVVSLNNLAWLYSEKKDPRAVETARRAYELAPQAPEIADTYAWILVEGGKVKEGLDIFRQVSEKATKNPDIQYHYAYALSASGDKQQAREVLKQALSAGDFATRPAAQKLQAELGR